MVLFKKNLEEVLVILLVCISLNRALADINDFNECMTDMENIFGLRTKPIDCIKIAIKDILFEELIHRKNIYLYTINVLKFKANIPDVELPKDFCSRRAIEISNVEHESMRIDDDEYIVIGSYDSTSNGENGHMSNGNLESLSNGELGNTSNGEHETDINNSKYDDNLKAIESQCLSEIERFGDFETNIMRNAIKYHKLGIRPEEYADKPEYFFHPPGSHGEAYMNTIVSSVYFTDVDIQDPIHFCYWINDMSCPE